MKNYLQNYLLAFFSFFIMSAFAMEENAVPSSKIVAKFVALGLTKEPKSATISQKSLLLEKDRQNAQNWLNKGVESQNDLRPQEKALFNYFVTRVDFVVPPVDPFVLELLKRQEQQQPSLVLNQVKIEKLLPYKPEPTTNYPYIPKKPADKTDIPSTSPSKRWLMENKNNKTSKNCLIL